MPYPGPKRRTLQRALVVALTLLATAILPLAGLTKDRTGGFGPVFVLVGLLPFIGLATLRLGWRDNIVEPPPVGLS